MYIYFNRFYCYYKKCMTHKSKITPTTSPLFCNPLYLAKLTALLISMLHLRMCNILKFTQNSLVVLISYLLTYSQQCFVTTLLRHIVFMRNVFCFNGFNQTAIVLRYSARVKPCKTIKTIKILPTCVMHFLL